ncbi:ankyrin repeat domain-containing protein 34A-like [Lineus longissimus]|uniref:ankyrin repeat domain-containing protein 34A-like n=1 Tax=Lineus longissimus TaxID=88925 RepID=UPI00315DC9A6
MSNLALIKAVAAARPRQVRLLLEAGINTENIDDCGQTALIRAVFVANDRSREKIVRALLRYGAKVSRVDIVGRNALSWGCLYGREKEVGHMLQFADLDLDFNAVDMNNQTALFHAATSGSAATVKLMVDALNRYGLNVDVPNSNGVTPLMHAAQLGNDVCASILIFQGKAKIGLTMNYPEDLINAERWATKIQREKEKHVISQFPPIIPQSSLNKIKYYESKAAHMRALSPFDSDDETTSTLATKRPAY